MSGNPLGQTNRISALIVGGGPAGAAAAIGLAQAGARPILLERSRAAHDVVCGGFLGRDALALLDRLGIDANALGARPIGRLRVIAGERVAEAALPFAAAGLSRRTLDAALLAGAAEAGAGIERGVRVRAAQGKSLRLDDGATLDADALFLATGKHDLRGLARPRVANRSLGLRTALAPSAALEAALGGVIELHLFRHGYAGLLLQEDGSANLCLSVSETRMGRGGIDAFLASLAVEAPRLGERIAVAGGWQAIAGVPYGWRAGPGEAGLFRLGDQAAVIASIVGDGVAIALGSGIAAAAAWKKSGPAGALDFQHGVRDQSRRPVVIAEGLRRLAQGGLAPVLAPLIGRIPGLAALLARATRIC